MAKVLPEKKVSLNEEQAKEVCLGLAVREGSLDKLVASCISNGAEKAAGAINAKLRMVKDTRSAIEELFDITDEEEEEEVEEEEESEDEDDE